jgi:hypothetical protein
LRQASAKAAQPRHEPEVEPAAPNKAGKHLGSKQYTYGQR